MKKGIIKAASDRDMTKAGAKHVIIESDNDPINPITFNDNLFYLHSNITREFCANESKKDYPGLPISEVEDEDGCGTGEYRVDDDAVMFPVAAYIHGGIALSLGNGSHFPDQRWDVTREAAWMWTDKKRFEEFIGKGKWMHVYDKESKSWRQAKNEDEFRNYLWGEAESLLDEWQMWNDGYVYGFRTEISSIPYKRLYPDGHTEDGVEWEDGIDSCWGFITDNADDIDFPRGDGWEVFDASGMFVGDEYEIPEFVITCRSASAGKPVFLSRYAKTAGVDKIVSPEWCSNIDNALTFSSWWQAQSVAQGVISKDSYNAYENCVEKDSIKEKTNEDE